MNEQGIRKATDRDRITAISAVLIGLVAVAAGKFHIANKGIGPAIIRSVRVEIDGRPVRNRGQALEHLGLQDPGQVYSSLSGTALSAGDESLIATH